MAKPRSRKLPPGIRDAMPDVCAQPAGQRCSCTPAFEVTISFARGERKRRTFTTLEQAKAFRVRRPRTSSVPTPGILSLTLREAAEQFLEGAEAGSIVDARWRAYRPSVFAATSRS